VDLYLQEGDIASANSLYNGIAASRDLSGTEAYEFSHWGRILLDISIALKQANKQSRELDAAQVSSLSNIANSAAMWAKVRAQNWLQLYDGRSYTNSFLYPPLDEGGNQRKVLDNELAGAVQDNAVYPNPAQDELLVRYTAANDQANDIQFVLTDLLGRPMLQQAIATKGTQKIAIDKLATGVYFYVIREQNAITLSGKLLKK
jgi:hypothetical protein